MTTMSQKIVYCAAFKMFGEEYYYKADTPEQLNTLIFGKASAPAYNAVAYWQVKENA
jgi:hypothetical protein